MKIDSHNVPLIKVSDDGGTIERFIVFSLPRGNGHAVFRIDSADGGFYHLVLQAGGGEVWRRVPDPQSAS